MESADHQHISPERIIGGIYYPYCPLMMSDSTSTVMLINGHKIPYSIFKTWPYMDTKELFEEFAELRGYTKATGIM
jgi:hypothetical protein